MAIPSFWQSRFRPYGILGTIFLLFTIIVVIHAITTRGDSPQPLPVDAEKIKAVEERLQKQKVAQESARIAEAKAEQEAFDKSKAGAICRAHPDWPKAICQTISEGKVQIGMTKEQAIAGWGKPDDINKTIYGTGTHEQWVYGYSSYLYFEDGILSSIQN